MVSDISSGFTTGNPQLLVVSPDTSANESVSKVAQKPKIQLAPIPKAEIKVDMERESQALKAAISKLNEMLTSNARSVSFAMDEKLGRPIVFVKNSTTGEVVRQIPNEVVVRIAHGIEDFKGLLHNKKI